MYFSAMYTVDVVWRSSARRL